MRESVCACTCVCACINVWVSHGGIFGECVNILCVRLVVCAWKCSCMCVCVHVCVFHVLVATPCLITDSVVRVKFLELEAWFVTSFPTEVFSTS